MLSSRRKIPVISYSTYSGREVKAKVLTFSRNTMKKKLTSPVMVLALLPATLAHRTIVLVLHQERNCDATRSSHSPTRAAARRGRRSHNACAALLAASHPPRWMALLCPRRCRPDRRNRPWQFAD